MSSNSENSDSSSTGEKINVQEINDYLGDFLQTSQPIYDPKAAENIAKENPRIRRAHESSPPLPSKLNDFLNSFREIFDDPIGTLKKFGTKSPVKKVDDDILHEDPDNESLEAKRQHILSKKDIKDIGQVYLDRKKEIYDASLINCAELHSELTNCFRNGSLKDRFTLCHNARDKFWNCMEQQKKLLFEMGYKAHNKTEEENEEILNQADIRFQQEFLHKFYYYNLLAFFGLHPLNGSGVVSVIRLTFHELSDEAIALKAASLPGPKP
ncbi:17594_t:CDS:2, partial [Acaulospora morrowiae]